ncbi:MAG: extracellular solute-binding protein [Marmoricola sp.]
MSGYAAAGASTGLLVVLVVVVRGEPMSRSGFRTTLLAGLLASVLVVAGCSTDDPQPAPAPTPTTASPVTLNFAVYGPDPVVAAYTKIAADFTAAHPETVIKVQGYDTHDKAVAAMAASREKGVGPDVFLIDQSDLGTLTKAKAVRRIDELLAERRVDFGDGYARKGLEAFSADSALQCMPVDVSPLVVYYNTDLIDLSTVAATGANSVDQENGWSLEEFGTAALQARSPGVRGAYVAPDLEQVAPFVWSGGGDIVDDPLAPTTLTLSDGSSRAALEKLLEVVRNPALTFSQKALARRSALERFKSGSLAMILGFRNLTPMLRAQPDLAFDVMPMPRVSSSATTATMTGLCLSSQTENESPAADFIADVVSGGGIQTLAETGYVVPANLDAANSESFAQPDQRPAHPEVFVNAFRSSRPLPESEAWPAVRDQTARLLTDLFYQPVILPLDDRLKAIDAASLPLFDPAGTPAGLPQPSATPSG